MSKRAERRHHFRRVKQRIKRFYKFIGVVDFLNYIPTVRKPCSCYLCGNTRYHWGNTKQEKIFEINSKEQIKEL